MKKIIFSVLAIMLAVATASGAAFALFSSTATVSGVTFSAGNANLQVYNNAGGWTSDYSPSNFLFENMYPGYTTFQTFSLKNSSLSNIGLKINAKLRDGGVETPAGSWNTLKDKVSVRFTNSDGTVALTGWAPLSYWNSTGADFSDTNLTMGDYRWYRIEVSVDASAGNEISETGLSGMKFDFLGTQN